VTFTLVILSEAKDLLSSLRVCAGSAVFVPGSLSL
jgi:hypothetical protein